MRREDFGRAKNRVENAEASIGEKYGIQLVAKQKMILMGVFSLLHQQLASSTWWDVVVERVQLNIQRMFPAVVIVH